MQNKGLEETYFMDNEDTNTDIENEINPIINDYFSRNDYYYFEKIILYLLKIPLIQTNYHLL